MAKEPCRYCGENVRSGSGVNLGSPGPGERELYAHSECVKEYEPEMWRDVVRARRRRVSGAKIRAPKNLPAAPPSVGRSEPARSEPAKSAPKRVTSTGRVGGGGKVVAGRHRTKLFGMRVTAAQLTVIQGRAAQREPYALDPATWGASEYMRALVSLDAIGGVDWGKLSRLAKSAEQDEEGDDDV